MTESTNSNLGHAQQAHTGTGNINNYLLPPGSDPLLGPPRAKSPRAEAEDELDWLDRRFEEPQGFGDGCDQLDKWRTVLVDGRPGDGRSAAARMLLSRLVPHTKALHEVTLDEAESPDRLFLDPSTVDEGDRLWLDLSEADQNRWDRIRAELSAFRNAVQLRKAALVVVLPQLAADSLSPVLGEMRCRLSRLPGMEMALVRKYLHADGRGVKHTDCPPREVTDYLSGAPPLSQVARLAQEFSGHLARGVTADDGWQRALEAVVPPKDAAGHFDDVRKGGHRALLLATAMLHNARVDAVHRGAVLLLDATHPETEVRALLDRKPFSERLRQVHAEIGADGRVSFTAPGSDALARSHLRRNFPGMREPLKQWTEKAVSLPELSDGERKDLARRFAEHSLAADRPEDLVDIVEHWVGPARTQRGRSSLKAAAHALRQGLRDELHGTLFLNKVRDWSMRTGLSPAFREVLVEICAVEIAVRHPDAALVRLHHLARREGRPGQAREALLELVAEDHRLLRRMLYRIAQSASTAPPADPEIFLDLSAPGPLLDQSDRPRPLLGEHQVCEHLVRCWAAVLRQRPTLGWEPRASSWVRAAYAEGLYSDRLLDILVAACGRRGDLLGQLYG
ncbi:hypothetical protein, partial [Streptomyces sp. NPDC054863]